MKNIFLLGINLLLICCAKESPERDFLADYAERSLSDSHIVYTENVGGILNDLIKTLKRDTLWDLRRTHYLVLTFKEKENILALLKTQTTMKFKNDFIMNGKVISNDTLKKAFEDPGKGWDYFSKKYKSPLYSFTKPIFIRDSLCFFYSAHSCGLLCGEGKFSVYKRRWGVWEEYIIFYRWIS